MARTITLAALIVLAALLFLPPLTPRVGTPPESAWADGASLTWTPYLAAAALALATAIGWNRGPGLGGIVVALFAIVGTSGAAMMTVGVIGFEPLGLAALAVFAATLGVAGFALAMRGWVRWFGLVLAWVLAALPYGCPLVTGIVNEYPRGLLYVIALGALATSALYGAITARA